MHKSDNFEMFSDDELPKVITKSENKIEETIVFQNQETAQEIWENVKKHIEEASVPAPVIKTMFAPIIALGWDGSTLYLQAPTKLHIQWVQENYLTETQTAFATILGEDANVIYKYLKGETELSLEDRAVRVQHNGKKNSSPQRNQVAKESISGFSSNKGKEEIPYNLKPNHTFDSFVSGESNQLAHSAALSVAENLGKSRFNPLMIYGQSGLGKTHLIQAVGNFALAKYPKVRVLYASCDRFTTDYVNSIVNQTVQAFNSFYRSIDLLIIDDIQFISHRPGTQDMFFHIFNELHQNGKQLILTSDKPPKDLSNIEDRLISRFQWGLVTDIQPPQLEMRMAILEKKCESQGIKLPKEIIEYIARNVTSSVRELEGVLIGIVANYTLGQKKVSLELVKDVIESIATKVVVHSIDTNEIKKAVSDFYNISIEVLEGKSRKQEIALARQIAMYLSKEHTQKSLKAIGAAFGGRDHTTVLHAVQMIENYKQNDPQVKNALMKLNQILRQ